MKSLNLKNLIRHYDHDTATAILELIKDGSIDRPRVSEGEKYLYIDTRILRAPYGRLSGQSKRGRMGSILLFTHLYEWKN